MAHRSRALGLERDVDAADPQDRTGHRNDEGERARERDLLAGALALAGQLGEEAEAEQRMEYAAVHLGEVDLDALGVRQRLHGVLDFERDVEVAAEQVDGAERQDAERDVFAHQLRGGEALGAVAAADDQRVDVAARGRRFDRGFDLLRLDAGDFDAGRRRCETRPPRSAAMPSPCCRHRPALALRMAIARMRMRPAVIATP